MKSLFLLIFLISMPVNAASVLIVGDSLSAGHGMSKDIAWPQLLQKKLGNSHKIINASISGETTSGALNRIDNLLLTHTPDIVIIAVGGNDGLRGYNINSVEANLTKIITKVQNNHAKVLLAGIKLPTNYGIFYNRKFEKIFENLNNDYELSYIPFLLENVALNPDLMQRDGIHPNAKAQPIILNTVWEKLGPLLL